MRQRQNPTRRIRALLCLTMTVLSPVAAAQLSEDVDRRTYTVAARADESLKQALNRATPIQDHGSLYHGYTRWFIRWRFNTTAASGGCVIRNVTTHLDVTITLPTPSRETLARFREASVYLQALDAHEEGHRRIARQAAEAIDAGIGALPPQGDCTGVARAANALGHTLLEQARETERQYDANTSHGCTQGACLP
ncbi:MAG: DUF922 domain-containing protein [Pseudomonadales bacterium]